MIEGGTERLESGAVLDPGAVGTTDARAGGGALALIPREDPDFDGGRSPGSDERIGGGTNARRAIDESILTETRAPVSFHLLVSKTTRATRWDKRPYGLTGLGCTPQQCTSRVGGASR